MTDYITDMNVPALGDTDYVDKIADSFEAVDEHDHSTGNGKPLPVGAIPAAIPATSIADGTVSNAEFQYINSLTSNAQTQLTTNATAISDHLADAADAHAGTAITNTPSGNLAATTVQAALNELQTDVDTRATSSALSTHIADVANPHAVTKTQVGLANADNTSDANKPVSTATQTALNLKANIASPTFTGTVGGITASMVGLGNVDNTADTAKPVSTAQQTALNLKADLASPTFTGTPVIPVVSLTGQGSTPASPSAGSVKVYAKTDDKVYKLTSAGVESELGAGSGGSGEGAINYALNGKAETDASEWTGYDDAAATPVDLTGGTCSATMTRTTTLPLRGTGSLLFTVGTLGEGFATTITPDRADIKRGGVQYITFDFEPTATIATGDYAVWVYDVANSLLIQPTGYQVVGLASGVSGKHIASFQLPTNGTTFRVAIHQGVASPAGNLKIDNFSVGPQVVQYGAPITDWETCPITGSWVSNTTYTGRKRRVGDVQEVQVRIALTGAPTSTTLLINTPSTIDAAKLANNGGTTRVLGTGAGLSAATLNYHMNVFYNTSTAVVVRAVNAAATYSGWGNSAADVTQAVPNTFANGDYIDLTFSYPVAGWSAAVQMSADADTRVCALAATGTPTGGLTSSSTAVTFPTVTRDTHGAYSGSTYTVKTPGWYVVNAHLTNLGTYALNTASSISIKKNGALLKEIQTNAQAAVSLLNEEITSTDYYVAGDTIQIFHLAGQTGPSFSSGTGYNWLDIQRVSGPAAIAATEKIVARATVSGATAIADNSETLVAFGNRIIDSHQALTTGAAARFTCPAPGTYRVWGQVAFESGVLTGAGLIQASIYKNGVAQSGHGERNGATAGFNTITFDDIFEAVAGDYFQIGLYQTGSSASKNSTGNQYYSRFNVMRLP